MWMITSALHRNLFAQGHRNILAEARIKTLISCLPICPLGSWNQASTLRKEICKHHAKLGIGGEENLTLWQDKYSLPHGNCISKAPSSRCWAQRKGWSLFLYLGSAGSPQTSRKSRAPTFPIPLLTSQESSHLTPITPLTPDVFQIRISKYLRCVFPF